MNKSKLSALIIEVMEEAGRVPAESIDAGTKLRDDLGFDSLELAILTARIEAEFAVDIFADGIVTTVGEIEAKIAAGDEGTSSR